VIATSAGHEPRAKLVQAPAAAPATAAVVGTVYTCPMHPEIRQAHPGNCPKCGMALGAKARLQVLGKGKPAPP